MTQMAEIVRAVPDGLPGAVGRRRADAAADGDRRPRHHLGVLERDARARWRRLVEAAERGDFAAARAHPPAPAPLMQVNFFESNPGPVKFAMAAMGLCEEAFRLPMVPPRQASRDKVLARAARARPADRVERRGVARIVTDDPAGRDRGAVRRRGAAPTRPRRARRSRQLQERLGAGDVRAAEPDATSPTGWRVNTWVKQGILLGFRFGDLARHVDAARWPFFDKDTLPLKRPGVARRRAHRARRLVDPRRRVSSAQGVICMPPMYINIGAYVGEGTLVDSHALVGSCAQIGARVHVSAAAQIGGVIEPVGRDAGHRRGRRAGRRQHRHLRRRGREAARGDRRRHRAHRVDAGLRPAERPHHQARAGAAARRARRRGGGAGRARR